MYYDNVLFFLLCFVMAFWLTVVLHCVMLCFVVLCCGVLCFVVLCCVVLYSSLLYSILCTTQLHCIEHMKKYKCLCGLKVFLLTYCSILLQFLRAREVVYNS